MKATVDRDQMIWLLGRTGKAIDYKKPLLDCVLLQVQEGRLFATCTNEHITIRDSIEADFSDGMLNDGEIVVPVRYLLMIMRSLPKGPVALDKKGKQRLALSSEDLLLELDGYPAEDFPQIRWGGAPVGTIEAVTLHEAIRRTEFVAATDDCRPILQGIFIETEGQKARFTAADGFRLATFQTYLTIDTIEREPFAATARAKDLKILAGLIRRCSEPIQISYDAETGFFSFLFERTKVVIKAIEGQYPNYPALIPQAFRPGETEQDGSPKRAARVLLYSDHFLTLMRAAATNLSITDNRYAAIRLATEGTNRFKVWINEGFSGMCRSTNEGTETWIAFTGGFIIELLKRFPHQYFSFELTKPSNPGVFRLADSDSYQYVIMPMFLDWSAYESTRERVNAKS